MFFITRAIFASLGKTPFDMLLFIVFDNGAANLTSFEGILSKPESFLTLTSLSSFELLKLLYMVSKVCSCVENFPEFA